MMNCVIIDDEPLAREGIQHYVEEVDFLKLIATGNNPLELSRIMREQQVDLVFLDIQTPLMNGIEFLKMTSPRPMVIITTAYPQYALEGFQLDVLDYLVKPVTFTYFFKAVSKARDYHQLLHPDSPVGSGRPRDADYFFVKCDFRYEKIFFEEILYIEAQQNYINIYTSRGKFMTLLPLKSLEEKLSPEQFMRVHKSFLVSISKIESIDNHEICIGSSRIPLSRNFQEAVMEKVVNNKLWKK